MKPDLDNLLSLDIAQANLALLSLNRRFLPDSNRKNKHNFSIYKLFLEKSAKVLVIFMEKRLNGGWQSIINNEKSHLAMWGDKEQWDGFLSFEELFSCKISTHERELQENQRDTFHKGTYTRPL